MCDRGLRNGLRTAGQDDIWALQRSYGAHAGGGSGRSGRHILYVTSWWIPVRVASTAPITVSSSSGRTIAAFRGQHNGSLLRSSAKGSGAVTKVILAVTNWGICTPTSNKFTVQIYNDACAGVPNTSAWVSHKCNCSCCTLCDGECQFRCDRRLCLPRDTIYWVVVTTSAAASQNATTAVWWEANAADSPST